MAASFDFKENIYTEYYEKVTGYIRSHAGNGHEVEDISSDVFLKIYAKLDSYDESKGSLSTRIFTITRNTVIDHFKSRKKYVVLTESMATEGSTDEDLEALAAALEMLSEREQDLIILHYYDGHTLKRVAEMMNISYIYAKVIHKKALNSLRTLMNGGPDHE